MRAILLAAGFGTRLRPLTNNTPKCLVTVGEVPLLHIWLTSLVAAGVAKFLVNTHYLAWVVSSWLAVHPLRHLVETTYEEMLLGTAGTLRANLAFCTDEVLLVAHADNLCLCDWDAFFNAHQNRPAGTVMTMMIFRTPTPKSCGIVEVDERGIVTGFVEKSDRPPSDLANAAIYLFDTTTLRRILAENPGIDDISTQIIPRLLGRIYSWYNADTVVDIGTPESLQSARDGRGNAIRTLVQNWEYLSLNPNAS